MQSQLLNLDCCGYGSNHTAAAKTTCTRLAVTRRPSHTSSYKPQRKAPPVYVTAVTRAQAAVVKLLRDAVHKVDVATSADDLETSQHTSAAQPLQNRVQYLSQLLMLPTPRQKQDAV
jgi:hypothetical protein